nr:dihydroorotate dehydrogenase electron transfer subunit [Duncaniella muricolitica]
MKQVNDFIITRMTRYNDMYSRLTLAPADGSMLPAILPGQFVQVAANTPGVFLRRPISINDVNYDQNTIDLLIRKAGKGTSTLVALKEGDKLNILLPLGNGFSLDVASGSRLLLIGGGVGVAPLLYLGRKLKEAGHKPEFLLGARSAADLLELDDFAAIGTVHVSTEDGSMGEHGLVTHHSALEGNIDTIYCCGPAPMMKAVASIARERAINCEVSLENMMACGLGACLCCVENTVKGNVCVCTEGPVFNINLLNWQ